MTLAAEILARATRAGLTITTAESCTGGMIAAALTDLPGSSAIFECGLVTYSNAAKSELLGVSPDTLAAHGAVSEEAAPISRSPSPASQAPAAQSTSPRAASVLA